MKQRTSDTLVGLGIIAALGISFGLAKVTVDARHNKEINLVTYVHMNEYYTTPEARKAINIALKDGKVSKNEYREIGKINDKARIEEITKSLMN